MALKQRTGITVDAYDFGSNDQTLGETMAIIDNLPRTGGVVVIGGQPDPLELLAR